MKDFIVFDLETNGLQGSSVLSISAIRVRLIEEWNRFSPINSFNRFYFIRPGEDVNSRALNIHKLSQETIEKHRQGVNYPRYFEDDINAFAKFIEDCDLVVGHGIEFDLSFIPADFFRKNFCTMKANTPKGGKWPKLSTLANQYGIPYLHMDLHRSDYDVGITFQVFEKMYIMNKVDKMIFL